MNFYLTAKSTMKLTLLASYLVSLTTLAVGYRLSGTVVPIAYQVHLNISSETFSPVSDEFSGTVIVNFTVQEPTDTIQLHAAHDFISINFVSDGRTDFSEYSIDNATDIVNISLPAEWNTGRTGSLYIEFTSRLSTQDMYGFYKSSYVQNGTTKYLATTQFQPVYARRVFPCFDEPQYKSTFEIYITYPKGLEALSNMPGTVHNTSDLLYDNENLTTTVFQVTKVMPVYLVAFIVSDFTCTPGENVEEDRVPHRICSRPETASIRGSADQYGPTLLRSLNNFTGISYGDMGFPKMDQVAIPDFAAGAMENWGLVTYREAALLWDPEESTARDQQNVANIIAHEFAHQWFGNLVTMKWWSELFLNEGFATYFEFFTTNDIFPSWELDKQFVVRVVQVVLASDSLTSSQALQATANSDAEVNSRFSQISYSKGGSILRWVEHILGTENFRRGLNSYLVNNSFQNTLPEDLWASLDLQLPEDHRFRLPENTSLTEVMENWVKTPGFPLVEVNDVGYAVIVRQKGRFLLNGNDSTSRWYVPLTYTTNLNPDFNTTTSDWLMPVGFVEIPISSNSFQWIILNNQASGFYRVNYNNLWENIISALESANFSGIPELNRASIVDDAFHLARASVINYTRLFDIVEFLQNDQSHHVWYPAITGFNFLLRRVGVDSNVGMLMTEHILDLLENIYQSVPWTNINPNNHAYTLKQVDVLSLACRLGLSDCINNTLQNFYKFKESSVKPAKDLRSIVYCNALRFGNRSDWNQLWNLYNTTKIASEKVRILSALGCSQDQDILQEYLNLSLDPDSGIRQQDALSVFTAVYSGSTVGINVAFEFLKHNHLLIAERYQSMNALRNMITGLAEWFTTQEQIDQLRAFIYEGNLQEDFHSSANNALQAAENNQAWIKLHWDELVSYYERRNSSELESPSTASPEPPSTSIPEPPPTASSSSSSPPTTEDDSISKEDPSDDPKEDPPGDSGSKLTVSLILLSLSIFLSIH